MREISFYTCVPKITIIWCTVLEIQDFQTGFSDRQDFRSFSVIFCTFTPLWFQKLKLWKTEKKCLQILSFTHGVQYMKIYGSWNIRRNRQIFLLLWAIFVLSTPWQPWKSKFWKIKKKYLEIYYMCTVNENRMMLVPKIWSATDRIFCHFGPFFALLHPYGPRKSKFLKHENNTWTYYYHLTHVQHRWQTYDIWFLRHWAWRTEFL